MCNLYLIIGTTTRYVPLLIGQSVGSPFLFKYNHTIPFPKIALEKQLLWDHVHLDWTEERIKHREEAIPLRKHITVPLKEKVRLRQMMASNSHIMYMVKQGNTWYNLTKT